MRFYKSVFYGNFNWSSNLYVTCSIVRVYLEWNSTQIHYIFFCVNLLNSYYDLYSLSKNTSILYFKFWLTIIKKYVEWNGMNECILLKSSISLCSVYNIEEMLFIFKVKVLIYKYIESKITIYSIIDYFLLLKFVVIYYVLYSVSVTSSPKFIWLLQKPFLISK